jgi:hypothetical protein
MKSKYKSNKPFSGNNEEIIQPSNKNMNRFKNRSRNNDVIDADYEVIKDKDND